MNELLYPILIPAIAGLIPLFIPRRGKMAAGLVALAASIWAFVEAIKLFSVGDMVYKVQLFNLGGALPEGSPFHLDLPFSLALKLYHFSSFVLLFITLFGMLVICYSLGYLRKKDTSSVYYSFILWTIAAASGAVLADNLLILLIFWEIVTALLFFLINMGGEGHDKAAEKTFTILGFTDAAMLVGIVMIWVGFGTLSISELSSAGGVISTSNAFGTLAFLLLFAGAIAKAGAMPFHSWIPSMAQPTQTPVIAFLPASLDKLLGIYLLARISLDIFEVRGGSPLSLVMMIVGAATIIFAVLMALVQHNLKKLLSFHAVSQVGYMVLGVGSGVPIAIIGGLFHMVNHAIYKSSLFLGAGAIEDRTGTTELEDLGGLARQMPVTFITMLVAALSISGIPPFNGFVSKWLVYQGMLNGGHIIFLVVAIFGSSLTLASFIKVLHSVFWGRRPDGFDRVKEVGFTMQLPMVFLAILCILFGVFASVPLERFIAPIVGSGYVDVVGDTLATTEGFWGPGLATLFILIGVMVGFIIYAYGRVGRIRVDENVWTGGNIMDNEEIRIPGTHFYKTVTEEMGPLTKSLFEEGERGFLDVYNIVGHLGDGVVRVLRTIHNGILSNYLSWVVIGLGVLAFILMYP